MGNISASRLGGLGLIIGPGLATILYLLLFMVLGDASGELTDFSVTSDPSALERFLWIFPGISLIFFLYGITVLHTDIKENGNNEALFRLGTMGIFIGILGIVISSGLGFGTNFEGITGLSEGYGATLNLVGGAIQTYTGLIFSIGSLLIAWSVSSSREGGHRIFACVMALVALINVVVGIINLIDTSTWEIGAIVTPITYVLFSIWSITLGLGLFNQVSSSDGKSE